MKVVRKIYSTAEDFFATLYFAWWAVIAGALIGFVSGVFFSAVHYRNVDNAIPMWAAMIGALFVWLISFLALSNITEID